MNPKSITLPAWITLFALALAGAFGAWRVMADTRSDNAALHDALARVQSSQPRIRWEQSVAHSRALLPGVQLSPTPRPGEALEIVKPDDDKPAPPPTDEELRAQLEADLNRRLPLAIIAWSTDLEPSAFIAAGRERLHIWQGTRFADVDAVVVAIARDHVLLDAAMPGYAGKRFEVRLHLREPAMPQTSWKSTEPKLLRIGRD